MNRDDLPRFSQVSTTSSDGSGGRRKQSILSGANNHARSLSQSRRSTRMSLGADLHPTPESLAPPLPGVGVDQTPQKKRLSFVDMDEEQETKIPREYPTEKHHFQHYSASKQKKDIFDESGDNVEDSEDESPKNSSSNSKNQSFNRVSGNSFTGIKPIPEQVQQSQSPQQQPRITSTENFNEEDTSVQAISVEKKTTKERRSSLPSNKKEKSSGSVHGSRSESFKSGISDMTDEGIITKWIQSFNEFKEWVFSTDIYNAFLWSCESTRFLIYLYTIAHIGILATIALILRYAIGSLVSGILYYNLIHAVAGLLGKASFGVGLRAAQLISKEFTARNMIKRGKGVSLTSMTHPIPIIKLNAEEGKTLRYLFVFALVLIEATVWFLGIQMEWEPAISKLGMFPCTQVKYTTKPDIASVSQGLGNFLQGDSDLSMIYSYGLPLGDGIVGGLAAWPLKIPSLSFSLQQKGVAFAVNAICGKLELAKPGTENGLTQFKITSTDVWSTMFSMRMAIQLPGGSHDWEEFADSDITQECEIRYIMGDAVINYGFVSDEWGGISSSNMQSIAMNDLHLDLYNSQHAYFGRVQDALGVNSKYQNITQWVIEATNAVFANASYGTSQGALFCNIFQWATLPDGYYHTDVSWKGMAAAISIIAHYVLMQYDDAGTAQCEYSGMQGAGVIHCPSYVIAMAATSVVVCLIVELSQLFWWFLLSGGGEKNDRAAKILENPMQLLYDLRAGGTELMGDLYGEEQSSTAIRQHYEEVLVRFGESRHTRPNPVGMLILGAPGEVMAMSEKREYY